jgi:phage terminase large subunit-like protein
MSVVTAQTKMVDRPAVGLSIAEKVARMSPGERQAFAEGMDEATLEALEHDWEFWARPNQLPPEGWWTTWLIIAGRGFGKTRTGAEWVRGNIEKGKMGRVALVARTAADVRDVMIEGESGILATANPNFKPKWISSKRRVEWPNGAIASTYSGDEPDQLRGPQHDGAWADELASWKYINDAWANLQFGLRLGLNPQQVVTTTPRPLMKIRELVNKARIPGSSVVMTGGSSYENRANLAPAFFEEIVSAYEGTRLGEQELYARILDDVPGALWKRWMFDQRLHPEDLTRVVVAIDPAVTSNENSAETGITVSGKDNNDYYYCLADVSLRDTPTVWAKRAIQAYHEYEADRIIGEVNNGGDMIEALIHNIDPDIPYKAVRASRGKVIRAEPISALYEKRMAFHPDRLDVLEDQLCNWEPGSDILADRMDSLVWGMTYLSQYAKIRKIRAA